VDVSDLNIWANQVLADVSREDGIAAAVSVTEKNGGPFANWERLSFPEGPCQRYFGSAVYVALLDRNHSISRQYLEWAMITAQRALEDERFAIASENSSNGWMNRPDFPGNMGEVRAVHALSMSLFHDAPVDLDALKKGLHEIEQSALLSKGKNWSDRIVQGRYLYAARLSMIAGDWETASRMLSIKRKFDILSQQFEILGIVAKEYSAGNGGGKIPPDAVGAFESYFQTVRSPAGKELLNAHSAWPANCYRLELSLIRQRISANVLPFPDWNDVFKAMREG
jgi:hypothetical protein